MTNQENKSVTDTDIRASAKRVADAIASPPFQRLAALVRVPFRSQNWRKAHPDVPFWHLETAFFTACWRTLPTRNYVAVNRLRDLLAAICQADPHLQCTLDDWVWLIGWANSKDSALILTRLCSSYATPARAERKEAAA